jgi:hypothetical protein
VILRSDVIRKELFGRPATDRLPPDAYAPDVSARVFATIAARADTCLAAGHAVIADAVYGHPDQRSAIAAVAAARDVPFHGIWLEAPLALKLERVAGRTGDASDADAAVVRRQAETMDDRGVTWRRMAADQPVGALASEAMAAIRPPAAA